MPCVVTEACIDCKERFCLAVCPIDCFFTDAEDRRVYVHQDECFECLCCYLECPLSAIFTEPALPPDKRHWIAINAEKSTAPDARRLHSIPLPKVEPKGTRGRCAATAYRGSHGPMTAPAE